MIKMNKLSGLKKFPQEMAATLTFLRVQNILFVWKAVVKKPPYFFISSKSRELYLILYYGMFRF